MITQFNKQQFIINGEQKLIFNLELQIISYPRTIFPRVKVTDSKENINVFLFNIIGGHWVYKKLTVYKSLNFASAKLYLECI